MEHVKCLIIGSGPAGYTAAIYASRANLSPVEYSGLQPGGQLTQTTEVENFPGYPQGVDGNQMMMDLREQAERFGTDIRDGSIERVDFSARPYKLWAEDGTEIEAETVIIATGASAKYLGLDDERKYNGQGVSACATCDGFRKPFLRASKVMQDRVMAAENIEILFEHNTLGLYGENGVEGAHLVKRKGEPDEEKVDIAIDGFFLAIGHKPNTDIFREWLETDETGYLKKIDGTPRTKLPGIFVAGDCADPVYRQAISAAGTGCQAAIEAERFLMNQ